MSRLIAPKGMNSLSVTDSKGRERVLNRNADGTFHVNNPSLVKKLKQEGLGVAGIGGITIRLTPCNGHESRSKTTSTCKTCARKRSVCSTLVTDNGDIYIAGMVGSDNRKYQQCGNLLSPCDCDLEK